METETTVSVPVCATYMLLFLLLIGHALGVRVEWMKARARALRWKEELLLLPEEIRRTIAYHQWKAEWWEQRAFLRTDIDSVLAEGLRSYSARQTTIRRELAGQAHSLWQKTMKAAAQSSNPNAEDTSEDRADAGDKSEELDIDDEGVLELDAAEDVVAYLEIDME